MSTKKKLMMLTFGLVNLLGGANVAKAGYDYDWAYSPQADHHVVLVCVGCWFWSCDC